MDYGLPGVKDRQILDQRVEESLRQAALWEEVKDHLKKVRSPYQEASNNGFVSRGRWQFNQKLS